MKPERMTVAVASGKGGTGKTTISASLASALAQEGVAVRYADCDVEEPNGHLFLKPAWRSSEPVDVPVPEVTTGKCIGCGKCAEICQFAAITCLKGKVLTFPELCHSCGGCREVCPVDAIEEIGREIGVLEAGDAGGLAFVHGRLNVGEVMSPPLIRAVRMRASGEGIALIDAPPGTSCPVITAIHGVDFVLLVTEPTPFGLNDLALALEMVRELGIPHGVVVNRHEDGNESARAFCRSHGTEIFGEIPDDRRVAEAYSNGVLPVDALPAYRDIFLRIWGRVCDTRAAV
jgi:MinD superfamily P-loop ATPase